MPMRAATLLAAMMLFVSCTSVNDSRDPNGVQSFRFRETHITVGESFELRRDCSVSATKLAHVAPTPIGTGSVSADDCLAFKTYVTSSSVIHALMADGEFCPPGTDDQITYTLTMTDGTTYNNVGCPGDMQAEVFRTLRAKIDTLEQTYVTFPEADAGTADAGGD